MNVHLGNVFALEQVIHVEEEIHGDAELEEIVDYLFDPVPGLHVLLGQGALPLPQGRGAALQDHLLDNPKRVASCFTGVAQSLGSPPR